MTPMTHTQDPTPAIPIQRKASRAMTATLVALFAFLFVMLGVNLYLLLRGWFILPAIGAIGFALIAAAAYAWMRSRLNRYACLMVGVGGAAMIGAAVTVEYWSAFGDESVPIACEVRDRDGAAIAFARCQVLVAATGESAGESVTDDRGLARFNASMATRYGFSLLQSPKRLDAGYIVRASAPGFAPRDVPLVNEGQPVGGRELDIVVTLEPSL